MKYDNFIYPLNYIGITQGFKSGKHNGLDLGYSLLHGGKNAPVYCIYDGVVESILKQQTGGNVIIIRHTYNGDIYYSEYGHLKDNSITVKVGEKVPQGRLIANMGNSGYYWDDKKGWVQVPYHLHFGIYKSNIFTYQNNKWIDPVSVCYLSPEQKVSSKTEKEYKILKINTKYKTGVYKCLFPMNIRTEPNIKSRMRRVSELTELQKEACCSKNPLSNATFTVGTKFTALEIVQNGNSIWAKTYRDSYICIKSGNYTFCEFVK